MQDQALERVVLHITQQHFFGLAVEFHLQQRGVEGLFLQRVEQRVVIDFDRGGGGAATKNDARGPAGVAQAAARTRTLLAALKSDELHGDTPVEGFRDQNASV